MKTVLVVLLILAAGAGAWFSGLSGLFGINGQYQDFKEMISYRKTLDKEIRTWTSLRNDMIKNRGLAAEENLSLISNKASVTQQRDEQLSKEAELKEEEVQLNADLSKINKQIEELKSKLQDFGVSSVQEIQEKMESLEASRKILTRLKVLRKWLPRDGQNKLLSWLAARRSKLNTELLLPKMGRSIPFYPWTRSGVLL